MYVYYNTLHIYMYIIIIYYVPVLHVRVHVRMYLLVADMFTYMYLNKYRTYMYIIFLFTCLHVCLFICLSVCLFVCLCTCVFVCIGPDRESGG